MKVSPDTIHKNMKLLRLSHGVSQEELSGVLHLSRSTYSAYETGVKPPDLQTIDALSAIYDISFDSLVNHDLSEGIINRVYFMQENRELADLLNAYQALSVSSKFLMTQRMDMLLNTEKALYAKNVKKKTK